MNKRKLVKLHCAKNRHCSTKEMFKKKRKEKNKVNVLEHQSQSPDLNPTEML